MRSVRAGCAQRARAGPAGPALLFSLKSPRPPRSVGPRASLGTPGVSPEARTSEVLCKQIQLADRIAFAPIFVLQVINLCFYMLSPSKKLIIKD